VSFLMRLMSSYLVQKMHEVVPPRSTTIPKYRRFPMNTWWKWWST
jgi:hypothetical protein